MSQFRIKTVVLVLKLIVTLILNRPFGAIIHDIAEKYEEIGVVDLRRLEKLTLKQKKGELDITFLKNCQNFHVFPKFLNFNIPYSNNRDDNAIRKRLLRSAIRKRISEEKKLGQNLEKESKRIKTILSPTDWYIINRAIQKNVSKFISKHLETHEKKMNNLTKNSVLPFTGKDTIRNLSTFTLSQREEDILKYGLNHGIPPRKVSKTDIFTSFELMSNFLTKDLKYPSFKDHLNSEQSKIAQNYAVS